MAKEYIDRNKARDALLYEMVGTGYQSQAVSAIEFVPTADVAEVRHGEWIELVGDIGGGRTITTYQCNVCGGYNAEEVNYCSQCGAKMD